MPVADAASVIPGVPVGEPVSSREAGDGPPVPATPVPDASASSDTPTAMPAPPARPAAAAPPAAATPAQAEQAAPVPSAAPRPGDGNSGFAELEQGWPASGATDASSAEPETQLAPNTPLSDEARAVAGRWVAAVINKNGAARLLASEDEWVFNLGLDARCTARQRINGKAWEQSGWWQLQGETLTLSLGPGGVWVFGLQREGDDIAIWSRAVEQTGGARFTLFCVRTTEGTMPPGVAGRYNSDFGPLRFEPSGPGHWRASYGDPLGKLNVARVGGFLAGRWEQQPGAGFVLFKLQAQGNAGAAGQIDGVWWYAGSTAFDGKWSATQAK